MKRLALIVLALAVLVGALSSCGSSESATSASTGSTPTAATPPVPAPHHTVAHVHYTACDQNIRVGPHTTCAFADNVFRAFAVEAAQGSEDATVTVTSPTTGKTYTVGCSTTSGATLCTGGTDARIRFPLWAAKVYNQPSKPEGAAPTPAEPEPGGAAPESSPAPEEPGEPSECTNGTYENSSGNTVCKPEESPTVPANATARCEDGTYSFSEHRSGTCSHHGGVAEWLSP